MSTIDMKDFIREQKQNPRRSNKKLQEGAIKDFFSGSVGKFMSTLQKINKNLVSFLGDAVGNVKRFFVKHVSGKKGFLAYEEKGSNGSMIGYLYPDVVQKSTGAVDPRAGSSSKNFAKAYIKGSIDGVIAFDRNLVSNASKAMASVKKGLSSEKKVFSFSHNQFKEDERTYSPIPESTSIFNRLIEEVNLDEARFKRASLIKKTSGYAKDQAVDDRVKASLNSADIAIPSSESWEGDREMLEYLSTAKVDMEDIEEILSEFVTALAFRKDREKDPVPSLLIQGFPGGGKTSIIKAFARTNNMKIHILEIASIYKEILGGFPVVRDGKVVGHEFADDEEIDNKIKKLKDSPDKVIKKWKVDDDLESGKSYTVNMTAADIFPAEDGQIHVFFMDEYNRDEAKMAAAMNLLLSGSIGNSYHLPLKTIVVAAGNLGKDIDQVNVVQMDSATFDRFDATVNLKRTARDQVNASFDYGSKGLNITREQRGGGASIDPELQEKYDIKMGGMNTSIDIWLATMVEKYGPELLSGDWKSEIGIKPLTRDYDDALSQNDTSIDTESAYMISTRKIEKINTRLKTRGVRDWIAQKEKENGDSNAADGLVDPEEYKDYFDKINERFLQYKTTSDWEKEFDEHKSAWMNKGIPSACALYLHICQWCGPYLPSILKTSLGGQPGQLITKIKNSVEIARNELRKITPNDVIFGYFYKSRNSGHNTAQGHMDAPQFKSESNKSIALRTTTLRSLCDSIYELGSERAVREKIGKVCGVSYEQLTKEMKAEDLSAADMVALNVYKYIMDSKTSPDMCAVLVMRMKNFGFKIGEEANLEGDDSEKTEKTDNKAAITMLSDILANLVGNKGAGGEMNPVVEARKIAAGVGLGELDDPQAKPAKKAKKLVAAESMYSDKERVLIRESLELMKKIR